MIDLTRYFDNGLHVIIAKSVIKKIASKPAITSSGKQIKFVGSDSCYEIVKNNYQDTIFDDIAQGIAETMLNMNLQDLISIDPENKDKLIFGEFYDAKKDTMRPAYIYLYKSVYKTLGLYSCNNGQKTEVSVYDLMYTDDNDIDHVLTSKASNFMKQAATAYDGTISDIAHRKDVIQFMKYVKESVKADTYKKICCILQGLIEGYKQNEIAEKYGLSIYQVTRYLKKVRDLHQGFTTSLTVIPEKKFGGAISGTITTIKGSKQTIVNPLTIEKTVKKDWVYNPNHIDVFSGYKEFIPERRDNMNGKFTIDKGCFVYEVLQELEEKIQKKKDEGTWILN